MYSEPFLVRLLAAFAAEFVEALRESQLNAGFACRDRRSLAEIGQGLSALAGSCKDGREVALGVGVFGILSDRLAKYSFGVFVSPEPGICDTRADVSVRVILIQPHAAFKWCDGIVDLPEFTQADAVVVGDLRVVDHSIERFEDRKGVFQIPML